MQDHERKSGAGENVKADLMSQKNCQQIVLLIMILYVYKRFCVTNVFKNSGPPKKNPEGFIPVLAGLVI